MTKEKTWRTVLTLHKKRIQKIYFSVFSMSLVMVLISDDRNVFLKTFAICMYILRQKYTFLTSYGQIIFAGLRKSLQIEAKIVRVQPSGNTVPRH